MPRLQAAGQLGLFCFHLGAGEQRHCWPLLRTLGFWMRIFGVGDDDVEAGCPTRWGSACRRRA